MSFVPIRDPHNDLTPSARVEAAVFAENREDYLAEAASLRRMVDHVQKRQMNVAAWTDKFLEGHTCASLTESVGVDVHVLALGSRQHASICRRRVERQRPELTKLALAARLMLIYSTLHSRVIILNHCKTAVTEHLPQVESSIAIPSGSTLHPAKRRASWACVDRCTCFYQCLGMIEPSAVGCAMQRRTETKRADIQIGLMFQ
jgi:hypothetical protein